VQCEKEWEGSQKGATAHFSPPHKGEGVQVSPPQLELPDDIPFRPLPVSANRLARLFRPWGVG